MDADTLPNESEAKELEDEFDHTLIIIFDRIMLSNIDPSECTVKSHYQLFTSDKKYSMISIISTGSIKRTGLAFFSRISIFNHVFLTVLVSIKRTGVDKTKHGNGFKQNV